jgi:WD40 repeat protein
LRFDFISSRSPVLPLAVTATGWYTGGGFQGEGPAQAMDTTRVLLEPDGALLAVAERPLASGGEAAVFELPDRPGLVAKVYYRPTQYHAAKLAAMLAAPPADPFATGHVSIAWPQGRLLAADGSGRLVGFVMARVREALPLFEFYNPRSRRRLCPLFHHGYLLRTARNLAAAVGALHQRGYVVGDLNETNVLANNQALVTLVDTDSFQVPAGSGAVYRCPVGKPEYTPPELQHLRFAEFDRSAEHDAFALAVLVFQLLMQGVHPFAGRFTGQGEPLALAERIARGLWPYAVGRPVPYAPNPHAPPFATLPAALQELFRRCFEDGHVQAARRPAAAEWRDGLAAAEQELQTCAANGQHRFARGLADCPWCDLGRRLGRDPFPPRPAPPPPAPAPVAPPPERPRPVLERLPRVPRWAGVVALVLLPQFALLWWLSGGRAVPEAPPDGPPTAPPPAVVRAKGDTANEPREFTGHTSAVESVAVAANGRLAVSGGQDDTVRVWDVRTGREVHRLAGHTNAVHAVAFSPDGRLVLSGSEDLTARLWDVREGREVGRLEGHTGGVRGVAFSADGRRALTGSTDSTLRVWDLRTREEVTRVDRLSSAVLCVALSADGHRALSGGEGGEVCYWDLDGDRYRPLKGHRDYVRGVAFSPDGQWALSGSDDQTVRLWDLRRGTEACRFERGLGEVHGVAFSPDGRRALTAGRDGAVRLWALPVDGGFGEELRRFEGHRGEAWAVAFAPDGLRALSGGDDGVVRLWGLSSAARSGLTSD